MDGSFSFRMTLSQSESSFNIYLIQHQLSVQCELPGVQGLCTGSPLLAPGAVSGHRSKGQAQTLLGWPRSRWDPCRSCAWAHMGVSIEMVQRWQSSGSDNRNALSGGNPPPVTNLYPTQGQELPGLRRTRRRLGRSSVERTCRGTCEEESASPGGDRSPRTPPHLLLGGDEGQKAHLSRQKWAQSQGEEVAQGRCPPRLSWFGEAQKTIPPR